MNFSFIIVRILFKLGLIDYFNLLVRWSFYGKNILVPLKGKVGLDNLYLKEDYDFKVYSIFKPQIDSGTFLDIGANVGQTILKIKSLSQSSLIAFEPNLNCVSYLEELKEQNKFENVQIIPCAVFDEVGVHKLYTRSKTDTASSLITNNRPGAFNELQFYWVNAIDSKHVSKIVQAQISFIKIDVEGVEGSVLKSLKDIIINDEPVIYCEVLDADGVALLEENDRAKREVFDFVTKDLGYHVFQYDGHSTLVKLDKFPSRVFSFDNFDFCNYIFKKEV